MVKGISTWTCLYSNNRVVKKTRFWGRLLLVDFLNLHIEKETLAKAVACTMVFNSASTMTSLSLNSRNRLFSCSGIGLLIGLLVVHLIKISFVKPEACKIIFSTASSVNIFMKQRNKKIKKCIRCCSCTPFFLFYLQRRSTKPEICRLTFNTASPVQNISIFHCFFQYRFFILLLYKFKYRWGSIKYYRTGLRFNETYLYGMKNKKQYEQPNP